MRGCGDLEFDIFNRHDNTFSVNKSPQMCVLGQMDNGLFWLLHQPCDVLTLWCSR